MWRIILLGLLLQGCKNPFRRRLPQIKMPSIETADIVNDWALYASYAGGLLIFFAVICLVWVPKKEIAVRLFANGFAFLVVGRLMAFFGDYMGWLLLGCVITGVVFNSARVEKWLAKIGIRIDINRDNVIGTARTGKPTVVSEEHEPTASPVVADNEYDAHTTVRCDRDSTPVNNDSVP